MRKIIATTFATVDGFQNDPQIWSGEYFTAEAARYSAELLFGSDTMLMGRVTYDNMAQAWPSMSGDPFADKANSVRKYVVSSTLEKAEWNNTTIIKGDDLVPAVTKIKEEPGQDILIWGFGRLTDELLENGLLDEYHVWIHPVLIGKGEPMFRGGAEAKLELTKTTLLSSGIIILTYRPLPKAASEEAAEA
ncbi:dihydrofolate reductase family protein [Streptosporangium sp. KLBMP 9127]|nr:dihydrofolate reductase family protein [Streptosporangium sp. KLBMP 9127]